MNVAGLLCDVQDLCQSRGKKIETLDTEWYLTARWLRHLTQSGILLPDDWDAWHRVVFYCQMIEMFDTESHFSARRLRHLTQSGILLPDDWDTWHRVVFYCQKIETLDPEWYFTASILMLACLCPMNLAFFVWLAEYILCWWNEGMATKRLGHASRVSVGQK